MLFDTSNSLHGKFKRITYHFLDKSQWVSDLIKILCENFKEFTWGICWSNITSPQKLQKLCSWWNDTKAIFFSFSQDIQHNSIQRSCMNYTSFQFSLKSRHCWRWNHFVPNIILALYSTQALLFISITRSSGLKVISCCHFPEFPFLRYSWAI